MRRRDPHHASGEAAIRSTNEPLGKTGALELLLRDRYLLLIALLVLLLNIVNNSGEFLLGKFVTAEAIRVAGSNIGLQEKIIGEFYGHYEVWYNSVALGLQMFAVSRIFKYAGVRAALFILPGLAMAKLFAAAVAAGAAGDTLAQNRGERRGLFGPEHHRARPVPAHQPGSEVQGQGRHRHLLQTRRRCARSRRG